MEGGALCYEPAYCISPVGHRGVNVTLITLTYNAPAIIATEQQAFSHWLTKPSPLSLSLSLSLSRSLYLSLSLVFRQKH